MQEVKNNITILSSMNIFFFFLLSLDLFYFRISFVQIFELFIAGVLSRSF